MAITRMVTVKTMTMVPTGTGKVVMFVMMVVMMIGKMRTVMRTGTVKKMRRNSSTTSR